MALNPNINDQIPYRRDDLKTGIVHFGVGGFHRAHLARYVDELLRMGKSDQWAICGVGIMPGDRAVRDALQGGDMSYVLVERAADGTEVANRIGSITEYLYGPEDPRAVIEKIADDDTKIISLTITEGGYNVDEGTGNFDLTEPSVATDLQDPSNPRTVFGYITEGLRRRRDTGAGPVTILCCDNIQHNGKIAQTAFSQFAEASDPSLAEWMRANVTFPSSMVDRITPATTPDHVEYVNEELGLEDAWPVVAEDFTQWVVEDSFAGGRPAFEDVGAQVVQDVEPYEKLKLRLLNASHQALAYYGFLEGHEFAHDAVQDQRIRDELLAYMHEEAVQTLDPVEGIDVPAYCDKLLERFGNESIADTLQRLATDGSDRITKFVVPVQRDLLESGVPSPYTSGIVAAWALVNELVRTGRLPSLAPDRQAAEVKRLFDAAAGVPEEMVKSELIFGDLSESPDFAARVSEQYRKLEARFAHLLEPLESRGADR